MAFLTIPNVSIEGIVSCIPRQRHLVSECKCLTPEEASKLTATTGIAERRIAEVATCSSDLCVEAANNLINKLQWSRNEIEAVVFVTQTPDYILPATSPLIQERLKLSQDCYTLDISLGCSGYVYGLTTLAGLLSTGSIKKALLLVGDTVSKVCSPLDKSTYPLFGDAGTATALIHNPSAPPILANMKSDGSGYKAIMINDGGFRNPYSSSTLTNVEVSAGISRNAANLILEGMDVFSFGITKAPAVTKELLSKGGLSVADVDYFIFHQANMMMNEKIRKKLDLDISKVPYSLEKYGNTSCATIPLTMTTQISQRLLSQTNKLVLCGFGVGLSWGAVYMEALPMKVIDNISL